MSFPITDPNNSSPNQGTLANYLNHGSADLYRLIHTTSLIDGSVELSPAYFGISLEENIPKGFRMISFQSASATMAATRSHERWGDLYSLSHFRHFFKRSYTSYDVRMYASQVQRTSYIIHYQIKTALIFLHPDRWGHVFRDIPEMNAGSCLRPHGPEVARVCCSCPATGLACSVSR